MNQPATLRDLRDAFDFHRPRLINLLPRTSHPGPVVDSYWHHIVAERESILRCNPNDVMGVLHQTAVLGLSMDAEIEEAFIDVKAWQDDRGVWRHQPRRGIYYAGMRSLAMRANPELRDMYARVVRADDEFTVTDGSSQEVTHGICVAGPNDKPEPLIAAYAVAVWRDGARRVEVIDGHTMLNNHRDMSPGYNRVRNDEKRRAQNPWVKHEEAMWKKTAISVLCGTLRLTHFDGLPLEPQPSDQEGDHERRDVPGDSPQEG